MGWGWGEGPQLFFAMHEILCDLYVKSVDTCCSQVIIQVKCDFFFEGGCVLPVVVSLRYRVGCEQWSVYPREHPELPNRVQEGMKTWDPGSQEWSWPALGSPVMNYKTHIPHLDSINFFKCQQTCYCTGAVIGIRRL